MALDWFSTAFDPLSLPKGLQVAYKYWLSAADNAGLPQRKNFNPFELSLKLLPNIAIFELGLDSDPASGRHLMIGTELVKLFRERMGPEPLSELAAENRMPLFEDLGEQLAEERRPILVRFADTTDEGVEFVIDMLILPLALEQDGTNLLVSVSHITENRA